GADGDRVLDLVRRRGASLVAGERRAQLRLRAPPPHVPRAKEDRRRKAENEGRGCGTAQVAEDPPGVARLPVGQGLRFGGTSGLSRYSATEEEGEQPRVDEQPGD